MTKAGITTYFPIKNVNLKKSRFHGGFLLSSSEKATQDVRFIINAGFWGGILLYGRASAMPPKGQSRVFSKLCHKEGKEFF